MPSIQTCSRQEQNRSICGISLVVQCLGLQVPNAEGPGSIPGQGTRSHKSRLKIPRVTTKIWQNQIHTYLKKKVHIYIYIYQFVHRKRPEKEGLCVYHVNNTCVA